MLPQRLTLLERHNAAVESDRLFTNLQDAANRVAHDLQAWDDRNMEASPAEEQEALKVIYEKCTEFCATLVNTFPIYKHICQDFLYGEFIKISRNGLEIHPFKNFQTYMVEVLRSLKPFFLGAKTITVLFQHPRKRFLSEFQNIKQNI